MPRRWLATSHWTEQIPVSRRDIILVMIGFGAGALVVLAWPESGSYEQCMVDKTRGQANMYSYAVANGYCSKRYGK